MYLAISPEQFNIHHIMLSEKTKNNVMEGGDFFRLYYSDSICNSNGLFIYFNFKNIMIEKNAPLMKAKILILFVS
jgi:hypothetical protein